MDDDLDMEPDEDPMDSTNPEAWFEHEFGPMSAVADYANDPPRGMNNPPMNRKLWGPLCKDLVEYGVELSVPEWSTSFVRSSSTPSMSFTKSLSLSERLPERVSARAQLMHSYSENLRQGRTLKKGSIFLKGPQPNSKIEPLVSVHPDWHQYHPFPHTLRPVDGKGPSLKTPSSAPTPGNRKEKRSVRFAEDDAKTLTDLMRQGSPNNSEFIKTPCHEKAIQRGKLMSLDPSGKRPSAEAPGISKTKGKDSGKDHGSKDEDSKEKHKDGGKIDNTELDNRLRGLRSFAQIHRSAVADRFRFGASMTQGEPMVLKASCLNQANPGAWSSDVAFLNKFHNSAIRILAPSGLEVLKEDKKRKKKKKKDDEDAELKMSDSGLFVARYPVDTSLIALRKMKRKVAPKEEEKPKEPSLSELAKARAAESLKKSFGDAMLGRVRPVDAGAEAEMNEAVAKSGYDKDWGLSGMPA